MTVVRPGAPVVDVVVVTYNSADSIRPCVEPLAQLPHVQVAVVDNASRDASLQQLDGLPVTTIALERNVGFAAGCNAGWRVGEAPYVLFLNPDARLDADSLDRLVAELERDARFGAAAPRITDESGALQFSQRRFPRLRSTYAQALFLHRVAPRASWADEMVRDEAAYAEPGRPDWVSGACVLVRRSALERLGGWDEAFFMYSEDADLCRRLRDEGLSVAFVPDAVASHVGGMSASRDALRDQLAWSRVLYARKHASSLAVLLERGGIALGSGLRAGLAVRDPERRAGHTRAVARVVLGESRARDDHATPATP